MPEHDQIPSLEILGDRFEAAAARSIATTQASRRGSERPAGSPLGNRWVLVPAVAGFAVLALLATIVLANGRTTGDTALADTSNAMRRSAAVATGTYRVTIDLDSTSGSTRIVADGAYDTSAGRLIETIDGSSLIDRLAPGMAVPPGVRSQLLVDRGTVYASLPGIPVAGNARGARWFRLGNAPGTEPVAAIGATTDPSGVLDLFGGLENIERMGGEVIDGSIVERYRGEIDLDRAFRDLPEGDQKQVEESLGSIGGALPRGGRVPVDVWIDDAGMVRRFSSVVEVEVPGAGSATARFTVDFTSLGMPVDIPLPDPADVIDMPRLDGLLGASGSVDPATTR